MATVTVTANLKSVGGVPDNTVFSFRSPAPRLGGDGSIVTAKWTRVAPVNGILTAELEPGPCVVSWTGSSPLHIVIPESDSDLWALIAVAIGVPPGTPQQTLIDAVVDYLSSNASPMGAQLITAASQAAARGVIDAFSSPDIDATADCGAVANSLSDQSAALQAAINATPDGGGLRIRPGRYLINTGLTRFGKSIDISAFGVTFVQNADVNVLTITGAHETILPVSSVTPVTFDFQESTAIPGLEILLGSSPAWKRGDVIKLVSDDEIPGTRPTNDSDKNRTGQFFSVHSVVGTTVTVTGKLHDPFVTNVRVARVVKHTARINGLRIESSNPTSFTKYGIKLMGLYAPEIDVTFGLMPSACAVFVSCYLHSAKIVADGGNVAPSAGQFTYGAFDQGGESGQFEVKAAYVRHAWDNGADTTLVNSSNLFQYGRSSGHAIRGSAKGTLATAWSTHTQSMNCTFFDCVAEDSQGAFALRGRFNTVRDGVAKSCNVGLQLFDEDRYAQDSAGFGHYVDGLVLRDVPLVVLAELNFEDATAPLYGQRDANQRSIIRNLYATGVGGSTWTYALKFVNQNVLLENIHLEAADALPNGHALFSTTNSQIELRNVTADYTRNTAGTTLRLGQTTSDSDIKISGLRWLFNSGTESRITAIFVPTSGTVLDATGVELSQNLAFWSTSPAAGSRFDYVETASGRNNGWFPGIGSAIATTAYTAGLAMSKRPHVTAWCDPSGADRIMAKLQPGAFRGQRLIVFHSGAANTVTVKHGTSSYGALNVGAVDVSLKAGQSSSWAWNGTQWSQEDLVQPNIAAPHGSEALPAGESTIPRSAITSTALSAGASGTGRFTYFKAQRAETISQVLLPIGGVALAADATLFKVGVWEVDETTGLPTTLVAVTADVKATVIAAAANGTATLSFASSFAKKLNQWYAVEVLWTGPTAGVTYVGHSTASAAINGILPRLVGTKPGLSDITQVTFTTMGDYSTRVYAVLMP